jgi:hypothetical protein
MRNLEVRNSCQYETELQLLRSAAEHLNLPEARRVTAFVV